MPILQIEHPIKDYAMWKGAFDRDPIDRRALGVQRYRVMRPVEDDKYIVVELEFVTADEAERCRGALEQLWSGGTGAPALAGKPRTRIVEIADEQSA